MPFYPILHFLVQEQFVQAPIGSLEHRRQPELHPDVTSSLLRRVALKAFGYYSRDSTAMRGGTALWEAIEEQVDAPGFLTAFEVPDTFQQRHSLLCLHVWLVLQRLRGTGQEGKDVGQAMYDAFQDAVEMRARATGVKVRFSKYLKEYEQQFYGSSHAMDLALDGKADLAHTLLRNVYLLEHEKRDVAALLARYVKR